MTNQASIPPVPPWVLAALGVDSADRLAMAPLVGGWSGSQLWRIDMPGQPSHVLRIVPGRSDAGPRREAAIHALVVRHGIPAPDVIAIGPVAGGTAMLMVFMPGIPLTQALLRAANAGAANALGLSVGAMLARIHAIPHSALVEAELGAGERYELGTWSDWQTVRPAVADVLAPWRGDIRESRLLHLDINPENVLVDPGSGVITAVLDWTNARLGPPIADLARTRSILRLAGAMPNLPPGANGVLDAFSRGFMDGHARQHGMSVDPAMLLAFDAWALEIQIADLAPKLGMPGIWLTEATIADLQVARDHAVAQAEVAAREAGIGPDGATMVSS
ncbi:MAG: phosphotransferase [Thermomicrobiales bacterium]